MKVATVPEALAEDLHIPAGAGRVSSASLSAPPSTGQRPNASVEAIVVVHNGAAWLAQCLDGLAAQLDVILESVAQVSQVATDDVVPTSHALPLTNVFRADEVRPSMERDAALSGAPATEQDRFRVPQILGEDA